MWLLVGTGCAVWLILSAIVVLTAVIVGSRSPSFEDSPNFEVSSLHD